jgi:glycosyltransferase involved in cell wall biosynthesis
MMKKKHLVISAVNLVEGGTLAVLRECLLAAQAMLGPTWRITALVHRADLVCVDGIDYIERPEIKRSWLARVRFEYFECRQLSRELAADYWFALHDMSPRVTTARQAVYCHNAMCFYRMSLREGLLEPKLLLFSAFYAALYRLNIHANSAVVVQQAWIRDEFVRRFGCRNVVVSHPVQGAQHNTRALRRSGKRFLYPSLPRVFKNFETLLEAWALLCQDPGWDGQLMVTINGLENRYAQGLVKRYGALSNVHFAGRLRPAQVQTEYAQADCLVFPSKLETWGLPLSEAKQQGLAILAADLPYAHEAIGEYDAAAFFPATDAKRLAQLMRSFAEASLAFAPPQPSAIAKPFASDWATLLQYLLADNCAGERTT